jgi:hypothetical protein
MIKISHSTIGEHRDIYQYIATARIFENDNIAPQVFFRNDIELCMMQMSDEKWWIVPNHVRDETRVDDIGPYDTVEAAAVMLRLWADRVTTARN